MTSQSNSHVATPAPPASATRMRAATSVRGQRTETIASFVPRAHGDAEARARAGAINTWERLYGEHVPWASGRWS